MPAQLVLLPSALQPAPALNRFAPAWLEALCQTQALVVETLKASRRFVRALDPAFDIDGRVWVVPNPEGVLDMAAVRSLWAQGLTVGLLSDAGYPAVGDPGAEVVLAAHQAGIQVRVLPGSCSFLMALAASGLGGQHFAFRGYVPIAQAERQQALKRWEQESRRQGQTQICMDTPYRNGALWQALLAGLAPQTMLCMALDLEGAQERIETKTVAAWRKQPAQVWPRLPAVFIFVAKN